MGWEVDSESQWLDWFTEEEPQQEGDASEIAAGRAGAARR
jgi:hypothetical protein